MKETDKISENTNLIPKKGETQNPKSQTEPKETSSGSDYTLFFYILLITVIFGVLVFFFFYIHYGSYKVELLVGENSKTIKITTFRHDKAFSRR